MITKDSLNLWYIIHSPHPQSSPLSKPHSSQYSPVLNHPRAILSHENPSKGSEPFLERRPPDWPWSFSHMALRGLVCPHSWLWGSVCVNFFLHDSHFHVCMSYLIRLEQVPGKNVDIVDTAEWVVWHHMEMIWSGVVMISQPKGGTQHISHGGAPRVQDRTPRSLLHLGRICWRA